MRINHAQPKILDTPLTKVYKVYTKHAMHMYLSIVATLEHTCIIDYAHIAHLWPTVQHSDLPPGL